MVGKTSSDHTCISKAARVAVELSEQAARDLVRTILAVLDRADAGGHLVKGV